jgi:hypothetical protein
MKSPTESLAIARKCTRARDDRPALDHPGFAPRPSQSYDPARVARSFRIEQTFSAATEPGEDLQTSLDARAPGFGAESVTAELSGDEWKVKATFQGVETREEAEARLGALLEASGFPPSATSSGATEIVDVTEETSPD